MLNCEQELSELPPSKRRLKCKMHQWVRRFLPGEVIGTLLAIAVSYLTYRYTHHQILAAYAGSLANTLGFYTPILIYDIRFFSAQLARNGKKFTGSALLQLLKRMLLEFGPAEILDSFIVRPFMLYIFPVLLHNYSEGTLIGKIVSDLVFYIPVLISQKLQTAQFKQPNV